MRIYGVILHCPTITSATLVTREKTRENTLKIEIYHRSTRLNHFIMKNDIIFE